MLIRRCTLHACVVLALILICSCARRQHVTILLNEDDIDLKVVLGTTLKEILWSGIVPRGGRIEIRSAPKGEGAFHVQVLDGTAPFQEQKFGYFSEGHARDTEDHDSWACVNLSRKRVHAASCPDASDR